MVMSGITKQEITETHIEINLENHCDVPRHFRARHDRAIAIYGKIKGLLEMQRTLDNSPR